MSSQWGADKWRLVRRRHRSTAARATHGSTRLRARGISDPHSVGPLPVGLLSKQKLLAGALPGNLSEASDLTNLEERAEEDLEADESPLALSSEDL